MGHTTVTAMVIGFLAVFAFTLQPAGAADTSKVNAATQQVKTGAKKIGNGEIGDGVEEMAKGIGNTVVEGAKLTGEKFKEAGKAAEPPAKNAWEKTKDGAASFGKSVKDFFVKLFRN